MQPQGRVPGPVAQQYSPSGGPTAAHTDGSWDSFFSKESTGHHGQSVDPYLQRQQPNRYTGPNTVADPRAVNVSGSAALDRANQLLRNLHQPQQATQLHGSQQPSMYQSQGEDRYASAQGYPNTASGRGPNSNANGRNSHNYPPASTDHRGSNFSQNGGGPAYDEYDYNRGQPVNAQSQYPQSQRVNTGNNTAGGRNIPATNAQYQHQQRPPMDTYSNPQSHPNLSRPNSLQGVASASGVGNRGDNRGLGGVPSQQQQRSYNSYGASNGGGMASPGALRRDEPLPDQYNSYQPPAQSYSQVTSHSQAPQASQGYSRNPSSFAPGARYDTHSLYEPSLSPTDYLPRDTFSPLSVPQDDFVASKRPYSNVVSAGQGNFSDAGAVGGRRKTSKFDVGPTGEVVIQNDTPSQGPGRSRGPDRLATNSSAIASKPVSTFELMAAAKFGAGPVSHGGANAVASSVNVNRARRSERDHSRSPSRTRSRSAVDRPGGRRGGASGRAPSDRRRSPSPPAARARDRGRRATDSRVSGTQLASPARSAGAQHKIDFLKLSISALAEKYNLPSIGRYSSAFGVSDLSSRFPKLYLPADLMRVELDWSSIGSGLHSDYFKEVQTSSHVLLTSHPVTATDSCLLESEPPSMTYVTPEYGQPISLFNCSYLNTSYHNSNGRSVRFNARVILTFGVADTANENERVDSSLLKKLRVLIGRRKASAMLLGGAWSQELDGGDPLTDRSCLLNTARRAVLAQSFVDIALCSTPLKLAEILYQRPQEEVKGKVYPEQDEVTCLYVCRVNRELDVSEEEFACMWDHYAARVEGRVAEPFFNVPAADSAAVLFAPLQVTGDHVASVAESHNGNITEPIADIATDTSVPESSLSRQEVTVSAHIKVEKNAGVDDSGPREEGEECEIKDETQNEPSTDPATADTMIQKMMSTTDKISKPVLEVAPLVKPTKPFVLIGPPPISKDQAENKQGISMRMVPLSHLLTHSEDDSSERAFEASLTAEILRSLLSVEFANIIADFIFAEHSDSPYLGDARVPSAVTSLRAIRKTLNAKVGAATKKEEVIKPAEEVVDHECKIDTAESEPKDINDLGTSTVEDSIVGEEDASPRKNAPDDAAIDKPDSGDSEPASGAADGEPADTDAGLLMPESEAKEWRKAFVTACRWFDTEQLRFLRADHIESILHSSTRYDDLITVLNSIVLSNLSVNYFE